MISDLNWGKIFILKISKRKGVGGLLLREFGFFLEGGRVVINF